MEDFVDFLLRAKRETYAAGGDLSDPSRPNSKDLRYAEGPYVYIDTYLGDIDFIGEEAVWKDGQALWGMNYYGWMKVDEIPEGFSKCLKGALRAVPREAPFRGPEDSVQGILPSAVCGRGTWSASLAVKRFCMAMCRSMSWYSMGEG